MKWQVQSACDVVVRKVDGEALPVVKLVFAAKGIDRSCLGLCLLSEGLVDELRLTGAAGHPTLRIRVDRKTTSVRVSAPLVDLQLSSTELERWTHFFLRTVRDGVAEVDHFDLEAETGDQGAETSVVVSFPVSAEPLLAGEARRLLGL